MKKLIMCLLLALPLCFTACVDDDDDTDAIVGTWKSSGALPKEVTVRGNAGLGMRIGDELIKTSGDGTSITFYDDMQITFSDSGNGTYIMNGDMLTVVYASGETVTSEFSRDGRTLTIYKDVTDEYAAAYPNETIEKVIVAKLYRKQ